MVRRCLVGRDCGRSEEIQIGCAIQREVMNEVGRGFVKLRNVWL